MSKWLIDRIVEEAGRRIYESQQSRLSDQTTFAAKRAWRSADVPAKFWDSYVEDARAALSLTSIAIRSYDEYPSRCDGRREEFAPPRIDTAIRSEDDGLETIKEIARDGSWQRYRTWLLTR